LLFVVQNYLLSSGFPTNNWFAFISYIVRVTSLLLSEPFKDEAQTANFKDPVRTAFLRDLYQRQHPEFFIRGGGVVDPEVMYILYLILKINL